MDQQTLLHLFKAYQQKTATPKEKAEFATVLHDKSYELLFAQVLDRYWEELDQQKVDQVGIANYDKILTEIKKAPQIVQQSKKLWSRIAVAASILFVASLGLYFYIYNGKVNPQADIVYKNDVAPGKSGATLTLANGQKILIADALTGNIANETGVKISKTADGQIVYAVSATTEGAIGFNTLSTMRGEQTQVRLPDGTTVFLNAETTLKYPTSFAKSINRKISLSGEAYFEVAKDKKHPFIVETNQQKVEVLGTVFNISSYSDEPIVKTTLLEGSVRITGLNTDVAGLLKPGEQSVISNGNLSIKPVDVDDVVAWKNGYFMFDNETLENVMKKVSRWYDVDVTYTDEAVKRKTFFGSVSRYANVSALLNLLQKTEIANFKINGKQIIVNQKK